MINPTNKGKDGSYMRKEYIRILIISIINLLAAGVYFAVLDSMGLTKRVYQDPLLAVVWGGGLSVFMIGVTLLLYKFVDRKPLSSLGFSFKKEDQLFSFLGSLIVLLCYWLFIRGMEMAQLITIEYRNDFVSNRGYLFIFPFLYSWVLAALHEETTSRAYFYKNLQHLRMLKMLFVSSFIFAVMHFFKGLNPVYFIILFITGFSFMYIYLKSGTVWVGTIIHAFMNFANSFFLNEDVHSKFSMIILKDIQGTNAYALYFAFSVGLNILLLMMTRIFYKRKE
jgi:membrane protease YdiL (CAAX protease family)